MSSQPLDPKENEPIGLDAAPEEYTVSQLIEWPRDELVKLDSALLGNTSSLVIAQALERFEVDERRIVLRKVSNAKAAQILSEMTGEAAAEVLEAMREGRAVKILEDFEPDDAADIVAEMTEEDRRRLLGRLSPDAAETVQDLMAYGPDTAGGVMTPDVDTAAVDMTVDEAIERIREFADKHEDLHYVYVVDADNRLQGAVSLRRLIQARPEQLIRDIMNPDLRGVVHPSDDREHVALIMAEYNLPDLAVVDENGKLLGVVTHDDVIDIVQAEATEDLQVMSGAGADETIHDRVLYSVGKRIPWLQLNLILAFCTAGVVLLFSDSIGKLPILAGFMPIIAGVGGNCGQQTLAVAIRSLAMGEVHDADTRMILIKQLLIGLSSGVGVGLVAAIVGWLLTHDILVGVVLLGAMVANAAIAGVSGAFIPLALRRFRRDPAQSSSIFLTAITDTAGFFIFLSLGSWLLL